MSLRVAQRRGDVPRLDEIALRVRPGSTALLAGSPRLRDHGSGRIASRSGLALAGLSAHRGRRLGFGLGVGLNRTAWQEGGQEFEAVLDDSGQTLTTVRRVAVEGVPVVVARTSDGRVCALEATCSHLGGLFDEVSCT